MPKGINLERIFCIKEKRVLRNDFTVVHRNKLYQVKDKIRAEKVMVEERIDGSLRIYWGSRRLKYKEIVELLKRKREVVKKPKSALNENAGRQWIPPKDHPWRKFRYGYAQY